MSSIALLCGFIGFSSFLLSSCAAGLQAPLFILPCVCREYPNKASFSGICYWNGNESLSCITVLPKAHFCAFCMAFDHTIYNFLDMAPVICKKFWRSPETILESYLNYNHSHRLSPWIPTLSQHCVHFSWGHIFEGLF